MSDISIPVPGVARQVISETPTEVKGRPFYASYNHDASRILRDHYSHLGYSLAIFEDDPVNPGEYITVVPHAEVHPAARARREWRELLKAKLQEAAGK